MSVYKTSNQHVATYLAYAGLPLLQIELVGKSLQFTFDDPGDDGPKLDEQFFSDSSITSGRALLKVADEIRAKVREVYMSKS